MEPGTPVATPLSRAPGVGINVANGDGSGAVGLYDGQDARDPAWSPDGSKIACIVLVPDDEGGLGAGSVWVMYADGSDQRQITDTIPQETAPAWSPDGTKLVFSSWYDNTQENNLTDLYIINADGSGLTKLTSMAPAGRAVDSERIATGSLAASRCRSAGEERGSPLRTGMRDCGPVAGWPAAVARTAVGALLLVAALPPTLLGVAIIAWMRDRVTRFGYSTLEAASAPISGIGLLLVAAGLAFLALCAFGLRRASRRMGLIFLVVGAALFAGGGRSVGITTSWVGASLAVG